jgi:hypothetical protein
MSRSRSRKRKERWLGEVPLGRHATGLDIANDKLYLASHSKMGGIEFHSGRSEQLNSLRGKDHG